MSPPLTFPSALIASPWGLSFPAKPGQNRALFSYFGNGFRPSVWRLPAESKVKFQAHDTISALGLPAVPWDHFATETAHSRAHPDSVRHPGRSGGDQRGAHVFLLGAGGIDQPRPPENQRNVAAKYRDPLAGR